MELFEKIYSCYYQVVDHILKEAALHPLTRKEMEVLADKYGYAESAITIIPSLVNGNWTFMEKDTGGTYRSLLKRTVHTPLTSLQKSWLKALLTDRRFLLFFDDSELQLLDSWLKDTEALYRDDYFHYYDRYRDGDSYDSPAYRARFQTILKGLKEQTCLIIAYTGRKKAGISLEIIPDRLQYSSKDDKFRLYGWELHKEQAGRPILFNLERIEGCHLSRQPIPPSVLDRHVSKNIFSGDTRAEEPVTIQISGQRNSLERVMLHFASYEKKTEYDAESQLHICHIYYDSADETELLIDILSFGPSIRVIGPEHFMNQMKQRITRQHQLFYGDIGDI